MSASNVQSIKTLEVRDAATFIPVVAIKLYSSDYPLLREAGWGPDDDILYLLLAETGLGHADPFDWGQNPRTMFLAHQWIIRLWPTLKDGDVVDIEHLEGWSTQKKCPNREYPKVYEDEPPSLKQGALKNPQNNS